MNFNPYKKSALIAIAGLVSASAWGSGYEKSIMFGGKSAGLAGIASPYISGSESLYFNPAGLVGGESNQDVTINLSPAFPQFKGPINNDNDISTSERPSLFPYSLTYAHKLNDQWALAIGSYISGGANANYKSVDFPGYPSPMTTRTDLMVHEYALGAGYKINDQWKVGAAWRVVEARAEFDFVRRATVGPFTTAIANAQVTNVKDTQYNGYKIGAQWTPSDKTQVGLTYRSEVEFSTDGDVNTTIYRPGAILARQQYKADIKTVFPQAVLLGVKHVLSDTWNIFGELGWTDYSRVKELNLVGPTAAQSATLEQDWKDQTNVRIAAEYKGTAWPIRFGYGWTSQVTDSSHARASFVPPADAHTVTAGTGYEFSKTARFDCGLEYTWASGSSTNGAAAGTGGVGNDIRDGKFSVDEYALHLGATYNF